MTKEQRDGYFEELAATAKAIFELYHPDKINYATFGDLVPHVHVMLFLNIKMVQIGVIHLMIHRERKN